MVDPAPADDVTDAGDVASALTDASVREADPPPPRSSRARHPRGIRGGRGQKQKKLWHRAMQALRGHGPWEVLPEMGAVYLAPPVIAPPPPPPPPPPPCLPPHLTTMSSEPPLLPGAYNGGCSPPSARRTISAPPAEHMPVELGFASAGAPIPMSARAASRGARPPPPPPRGMPPMPPGVATVPFAVPLSPFPSALALAPHLPAAELAAHIRAQIEFYFTDENLVRDSFLRRQMDGEGWVGVDVITCFNRVRQLCVDPAFVAASVAGSRVLELRLAPHPQCACVRRAHDWARWVHEVEAAPSISSSGRSACAAGELSGEEEDDADGGDLARSEASTRLLRTRARALGAAPAASCGTPAPLAAGGMSPKPSVQRGRVSSTASGTAPVLEDDDDESHRAGTPAQRPGCPANGASGDTAAGLADARRAPSPAAGAAAVTAGAAAEEEERSAEQPGAGDGAAEPSDAEPRARASAAVEAEADAAHTAPLPSPWLAAAARGAARAEAPAAHGARPAAPQRPAHAAPPALAPVARASPVEDAPADAGRPPRTSTAPKGEHARGAGTAETGWQPGGGAEGQSGADAAAGWTWVGGGRSASRRAEPSRPGPAEEAASAQADGAGGPGAAVVVGESAAQLSAPSAPPAGARQADGGSADGAASLRARGPQLGGRGGSGSPVRECAEPVPTAGARKGGGRRGATNGGRTAHMTAGPVPAVPAAAPRAASADAEQLDAAAQAARGARRAELRRGVRGAPPAAAAACAKPRAHPAGGAKPDAAVAAATHASPPHSSSSESDEAVLPARHSARAAHARTAAAGAAAGAAAARPAPVPPSAAAADEAAAGGRAAPGGAPADRSALLVTRGARVGGLRARKLALGVGSGTTAVAIDDASVSQRSGLRRKLAARRPARAAGRARAGGGLSGALVCAAHCALSALRWLCSAEARALCAEVAAAMLPHQRAGRALLLASASVLALLCAWMLVAAARAGDGLAPAGSSLAAAAPDAPWAEAGAA